LAAKKTIAVADLRFELVVQRDQLGKVRVARRFGHDQGGIAFEQREQVIDLVEVTLGHFGDVGAAPQLHRDQPLGGEHLQRLAQGSAADAVLRGERLLVDPAARGERVGEDAGAQRLGHLLIQSALGERRTRRPALPARCKGERNDRLGARR